MENPLTVPVKRQKTRVAVGVLVALVILVVNVACGSQIPSLGEMSATQKGEVENGTAQVLVEVDDADVRAYGGHLHVYLNDRLMAKPPNNSIVLPVPVGENTIRVDAADKYHRAYIKDDRVVSVEMKFEVTPEN